MTMVAIRITPENTNAILATESVSPDELQKMMDERGTPESLYGRFSKYYFIPTYDRPKNTGHTWTWIRDDLFEDGTFTADMIKIDTNFVEIVRNKIDTNFVEIVRN